MKKKLDVKFLKKWVNFIHMKAFQYSAILLTLLLGLSSFLTLSVKKPEKSAKQVLNLLKQIGQMSSNEYVENFISHKEMQEIATSSKLEIDERHRKEMISISDDDWAHEMDEDYRRLTRAENRYGINWKEIKLIDYTYKVDHKKGWGGIDGNLFFESNGKKFRLKVFYLFDGTKYKLGALSSLIETKID